MKNNFEDYYNLPKDERWIENPDNIGGRDTDISQIGFSLERIVKEIYPINGVPQHLFNHLFKLKKTLSKAEDDIEAFINEVSLHQKELK